MVQPYPLLTIRKFTSRDFTMDDLVARGMVSLAQSEFLSESVRRGDNMLISGGTSTGKTTLLNSLANAIPETERIFVIEDTAELHLRKPHVVAQEAQTDTHHRPVTFDDLLRAALRHRPDRILLGEIRGAEARILLDAMNTGHRGTLATVHASSAAGALVRMRTLLMRGRLRSGHRKQTQRFDPPSIASFTSIAMGRGGKSKKYWRSVLPEIDCGTLHDELRTLGYRRRTLASPSPDA